jgi:DNA-binding transcriptional regulator GbsR (MarR family)
MAQDLSDIRSNFIEQMGLDMQADGFPRIAGRLMGLLVFDGTPYSFSDLANELQVSRGSISANTRLLLDKGVIDRVAKPGDRQDYYQIGDNPYANMLRRISERAARTSDMVGRVVQSLPRDEEQRIVRLRRHSAFFAALSHGFMSASEKIEP